MEGVWNPKTLRKKKTPLLNSYALSPEQHPPGPRATEQWFRFARHVSLSVIALQVGRQKRGPVHAAWGGLGCTYIVLVVFTTVWWCLGS